MVTTEIMTELIAFVSGNNYLTIGNVRAVDGPNGRLCDGHSELQTADDFGDGWPACTRTTIIRKVLWKLVAADSTRLSSATNVIRQTV